MHQTLKSFSFFAVALLVGIAVGFSYHWISTSELFHVESFEIQGANEISENSIQDSLRPFIGQPLYKIRLAQVAKALQNNPWIENIKVSRSPPHQIVVRIQEKNVVAQLKEGGKLFLVDEKGGLFSVSSSKKESFLPIIQGISKNHLHMLANAIHSHVEEGQPGDTISKVKYEAISGVNVVLKNNVEISLGSGSFDKKWKKFSQILDLLGDKSKDLAYVNLSSNPDINRVAIRFLSPATLNANQMTIQ